MLDTHIQQSSIDELMCSHKNRDLFTACLTCHAMPFSQIRKGIERKGSKSLILTFLHFGSQNGAKSLHKKE